jgi:glycosyltransferase involved in cell wall biosynthesis
MARIDVIVPCYRYAHFLRECVGSVLSQSLMDLRVLIIDDASPDDTADVAASLAAEDCRVEVLSHRVNRGHIATYNAGIDWATADYLLLLSADDVLLPGALARAVRLMDDNPEVGFTYGRVIYFPDGFPTHQLSDPDIALRDSPFQTSAAIIPPDRGRRARSRRVGAADRPKRGRSAPRTGARGEGEWEIFSGIEFIRSSRHSNQVHTATAIVRTALQKKIGGYRQELPHAGDVEMWLRFAVHAPVGYVNAYQGAARLHGQNMSRGYYEDTIFDLRQRKLLLDTLFQHYGDRIPAGASLQAEMYRGLAEAAVRSAGVPFSKGDAKGCNQILEFATTVDPGIRHSLLWSLFGWKRRLGLRTSSVVSPVVRFVAAYLFRFAG